MLDLFFGTSGDGGHICDLGLAWGFCTFQDNMICAGSGLLHSQMPFEPSARVEAGRKCAVKMLLGYFNEADMNSALQGMTALAAHVRQGPWLDEERPW